MNRLLDILARTPVLILSGLAMLGIGYGFSLFLPELGGRLLDTELDAAGARALLAQLTPDQQRSHLWLTLGLDSLYPLAYGSFFAGLLTRLTPGRRLLAAAPALISVVVDFAENTVQALALAQGPDLLVLKNLLTPLKYTGLALTLALILGFAGYRLLRWLLARRQ